MSFPPNVVQLPVLFISVNDALDTSVVAAGAPADYPMNKLVDPTKYTIPKTFAQKMMSPEVVDEPIVELGEPLVPDDDRPPPVERQLEDFAMYVAAFVGRLKRRAYCIINLQRNGLSHPGKPDGIAYHALSLMFFPSGKVEFFDIRGYAGPYAGQQFPERRKLKGWHNEDYYDPSRLEAFMKRLINRRIGDVVTSLEPKLKLKLERINKELCYRTLVSPQSAQDRKDNGVGIGDCRYATVLYTYMRAKHPRMKQTSVIHEWMRLFPEDEPRFRECLRKSAARKRKRLKSLAEKKRKRTSEKKRASGKKRK